MQPFVASVFCNAGAEPVELDPRLRRRPVAQLDFNALVWAMKTLKVLLLLMLLLLLLLVLLLLLLLLILFQITDDSGKKLYAIKNLSWLVARQPDHLRHIIIHPSSYISNTHLICSVIAPCPVSQLCNRFICALRFGNKWVTSPKELCSFILLHRYASR